MSISIICPNRDLSPWIEALNSVDPNVEVELWPNESDKTRVEFALCWNQPEGVLNEYTRLKCICSMGAGIDHFLKDTTFPVNLPVLRLIDPSLANAMIDYLTSMVMYYYRDIDRYQRQQQESLWKPFETKPMSSVTIGIMGLGELGGKVASHLSSMGFNVLGWSRTKKSIDNVTTYSANDLSDFLQQSSILICLLPLTEDTKGILDKELFYQLPRQSCVINVARGEHLNETDLIEAIDDGQIRGACLDVFAKEPLPKAHAFWGAESIIITPHCSSATEPLSVAPQIIENYHLMKQGRVLNNQVDMDLGY